MVTLEGFLKTGQLGPIMLGMAPFDVESILGEPQEESRRKNPLVLGYGGLKLSFWRRAPKSPSRLNQIVIKYQPTPEPLPQIVRPSDWTPTEVPTMEEFQSFLRSVGYKPHRSTGGSFDGQVKLPSGVVAAYSAGKLERLQMDQRQDPESTDEVLTDEREPSVDQIEQMFHEAETVMRGQAPRAALVLAWAGLEAVLRRKALMAGLQGRIGVQPMVFIRELQATGNITPEEFAFIDQIRQARTATAHGLAPTPIKDDAIATVMALGRRLLHELTLHPST